jgi:acyl-CoA synthetase (AMP-forming)/AMP-acid ligase II
MTQAGNIAATLVEAAALRPDAPAVIAPRGTHRPVPQGERRWSFRQLDDESDRLARGLARRGVARGARAVLMMPPSPDFYALTFALFKLGAVVVLIDPGMGVKNLGVCLAEAAPEAFIGVPKAHLARLLFGWGRKTLRLSVGSLRRLRRDGEQGGPVLTATAADETAAVLFTSGSTGVAKGVVYTHGVFAAQVESLRSIYHIEPGEIDLPTFPLFGLFGPALGMTAVVPEMDFTRPARVDPRRILHAVRHYGVTNLFGSPALLRRVAFSREAQGVTLPTLRRVISAGAPVPAAVVARVARLLGPGVQVHTPYGATEALPVSSIGSDELLRETAAATAAGKGVCVGRPVPGMTVKVIGIRDEPIDAWSDALEIAAGEVGEIVVRGPVLTRAYHNRPDSTKWAKIPGPGKDELWHRMGDVGYRDASGRVWFCGRKTHRVITPAGSLFTIPCEGVFNAHPAVFRTALVGVDRNGATAAELCVELLPDFRGDREQVRRELLALGAAHAHTAAIRAIHFHPAFPVDVRHNAKIFREKLAVWAAAREARA